MTIDSFARPRDRRAGDRLHRLHPAAHEPNGGAAGTHTIKVEFLNNFKTANGSCDRNLYLDKVTIRQTSPAH